MIEHEQNRIRKQRQDFKLSQREFALTTGIPLGTVRNWEQEKCSPPEYLYGILYELLRRNSMLNVKTLKVVALLNELAEKEKNGIREFKNADEDNRETFLFYDGRVLYAAEGWSVALQGAARYVHHRRESE